MTHDPQLVCFSASSFAQPAAALRDLADRVVGSRRRAEMEFAGEAPELDLGHDALNWAVVLGHFRLNSEEGRF